MDQQTNSPSEEDSAQPEPLQAAFLVRCWKHRQTWRFSLENISTRQRYQYATAAELLEGVVSVLANLDEQG